jgi:hypothetical protein
MMTIREFSKKLAAGLSFVALAFVQVGVVHVAQLHGESDLERPDTEGVSTTIYDNGGLATGATSASGVAAPAGTQWSEAQNDFGFTNQANTVAGQGCQGFGTTNNRCADDFNVPVGQTWTINQVVVFVYQTGFAGTTSPVTAATLRIWNGRPGDAGSTIVFGDTTTNRLASSVDSLLFRIFNSIVGPGANPPSAPGTTRKIWTTTLNVSPGAVLSAGNYWIDWQTNTGVTHFAPTISIVGTRDVPGWNARQSVNGGTSWQDPLDQGQAPTGQPIPYVARQDFPFKLIGSVTGAPTVPRSRTIDFDGDNKTDLAVARSASAASQTTWQLSNSGGTTAGVAWGLGVGLAGGDVAIPADYDGDGKTDIAVWRPGAIGTAATYVLKSNGNVVDVDAFGQTGDDPTIVGDYDGDGKADLAVYRAGAQSHFWYQYSTSLGNGCSGTSLCNDVSLGTTGDKPYPGDFDGDRKYDFAVVRNSGGAAIHYQILTTAGYRALQYGLFTDKFLTGDFDADGRTDFAALRTNGANLDWYVLHSGNGQLFFFPFGASATDVAVPGDYDGDKKTDYAVWRNASGLNYLWKRTSTSPVSASWGTTSDYPVATAVNVH